MRKNQIDISFRNLLCIVVLFHLANMLTGCKKLVEVDPPIDELVGEEIYGSDGTAVAVLTGIYTDMSRSSIFSGQGSITVRAGLSADELVNTTDASSILHYLYTNSLTTNGGDLGFWNELYGFIFRANSAIEGINNSSGISVQVKRQLLGESKFIRSFCYYYLVSLYDGVPLVLTTNANETSKLPRESAGVIYDQIVKDLQESVELLRIEYVYSDATTETNERIRPNKATAIALLSRVYVNMSKWDLAEITATQVIENSQYYQLEELERVFLRDSKEAVWQLQPVSAGDNTMDARIFVLKSGVYATSEGPDGDQYRRPVYLSPSLYNAFELNDRRKTIWTDSVIVGLNVYPFSYKYKAWDIDQTRTEYLCIFRLAEQYLIRAEARANLGKILGGNSAESDLNTVRTRAGLPNTLSIDKEQILSSILHERQVELFTEWGHRWIDLRRMSKIDEVMTLVAVSKGTNWSHYKALYPIPVQEIQRNAALKGHQNPGYPEM